MSRKSEHLSQALHDYVVAHSTQPDEVLTELAAETVSRFGADDAGMQIGPEQGTFMTLLAKLIGAASAVEVGTFTGYSAICIARGLADGGRLLCCDVSEEWTSLAREYWKRAGVADQIELRLGPAAQTLRALPAGTSFDLRVHRRGQDRLRRVLGPDRADDPAGRRSSWSTTRSPTAGSSTCTSRTTTSRASGASTATPGPTQRVELVLLPVGDGLTMARKL